MDHIRGIGIKSNYREYSEKYETLRTIIIGYISLELKRYWNK